MDYITLAPREIIEKTMSALKSNGIDVEFVSNREEAKQRVLKLIPEQAEVFTTTSVTTDTIGLSEELNNSGKYNSVRNKLNAMDRTAQNSEMQKLGAAPDWVVGSIHAVTQDGQVFIASRSGSQIPPYAYGASHVIWVVGVQKIVENSDAAFKRIYEHSLKLESERVKQAYGMESSSVDKVLIINKESAPNRIRLIFVNELLGY